MKNSYGWVIVAAGALMTCVGMGALFSLAVFLQPISTATGWSRTGVSSAMTLDFLSMGVAAFLWGALADRYGTRFIVLIGSLLVGLGLVLASRATTLLEFQLVYGIVVGFAAGSFYAPMMAAVSVWFDQNRALAVSLVSVGIGVAPMTVSPAARWLITAYDWRTAMLIIGIAAWVLLVPASLLVRRPPNAAATPQPGTSPLAAGPAAPSRMTALAALRSPHFAILATTFFFCCAAHAGPIFHTVSYAMYCGIAPMTAVTIYSLEGFAGLVGRLLFGVLADRIGVKRVIIGGLLVQAIAIAIFVFVSRLGEFYGLSAIFGMAYGGVMPLYAVLAREYFGAHLMGTVIGAMAMISSIGMAFGPWAGGWVFDHFNEYTWLYLGASALGFAAVAMALAFPALPTRRRQMQPA